MALGNPPSEEYLFYLFYIYSQEVSMSYWMKKNIKCWFHPFHCDWVMDSSFKSAGRADLKCDFISQCVPDVFPNRCLSINSADYEELFYILPTGLVFKPPVTKTQTTNEIRIKSDWNVSSAAQRGFKSNNDLFTNPVWCHLLQEVVVLLDCSSVCPHVRKCVCVW